VRLLADQALRRAAEDRSGPGVRDQDAPFEIRVDDGDARAAEQQPVALLADPQRILGDTAAADVADRDRGPALPIVVNEDLRDHVRWESRPVGALAGELADEATRALALGERGREPGVRLVHHGGAPDPAELRLGIAEHPARRGVGGDHATIGPGEEQGVETVVDEHAKQAFARRQAGAAAAARAAAGGFEWVCTRSAPVHSFSARNAV